MKAIVIACNTATAYGLDDIGGIEKWKIPLLVVGVVEAGGHGVIDAMRQDTTPGAAAVLATVGTCSSNAYPKTIARLAGRQGLQAPVVCQQGSVGLAGAIESDPAFVATPERTRPLSRPLRHQQAGEAEAGTARRLRLRPKRNRRRLERPRRRPAQLRGELHSLRRGHARR